MTSEIYYPEQRHLLGKSTIRRRRMLPDYSSGETTVNTGARVGLHDTVGRGSSPSPYVLVDAMHYFNLKNPDAIYDLLEVRVGDQVVAGDVLAGRGGRRGKRLLAPVTGRVVEVDQGRIVMQEVAPHIELEAGLNGTVVGVEKGRGVTIEAYGAVVQGVWGNNRRAIGTIHVEPSEGIENIYGDVIDTQFRGALVVTRRPLRRVTLQVIEDQALSGVIAPSIEPDLIDTALHSVAAIVLTEGFGEQRMSNVIAQFLDDMDGRQAMVDAVLPVPLETRRPEVIITVPLEPGERPPPPNLSMSVRLGIDVRLTRGELAGMIGRVIGLPKDPVLLDNGLRTACAQVEMVTGERAFVPLANIEVSGS